jgi:hypothetical protein
MSALKHKGMKAPRPGSYKLDEDAQKDAPKVKPSMQHKEPAYAKEEGAQSKAPSVKKKALPSQDAPPGVKGVNAGDAHPMPKGGGKGETEV